MVTAKHSKRGEAFRLRLNSILWLQRVGRIDQARVLELIEAALDDIYGKAPEVKHG